MDGRWVEVGDGVLARRHGELDLTTGLVLGDRRALVIDTRGDARQGAELAAAIREVTVLPVVVAITHAHFDHCFGTGGFPGVPVYAQTGCAAAIRATATDQRAEWARHYRDRGEDRTADALAATDPRLPDRPVCTDPGDRHVLDLGGRTAVLLHPGPGHTDHDLAVHVPDPGMPDPRVPDPGVTDAGMPDAGVLFAGDLLENGAPPSHGPDAHPDRWPDAVAVLLACGAATLVPGHGDPMTPHAAATQHAELVDVATLYRAVAAGELDPATADAHSPHPGVPWPAGR